MSKIQVYGSEITICVKSKPERGKANKDLVEKVAGYFGLSIRNSTPITGKANEDVLKRFCTCKKQLKYIIKIANLKNVAYYCIQNV